jgi:hypothetical protein
MNNDNKLLNPTPSQIKYRNRKWSEALINNERKARGTMYSHDGGRCCLAVAQDVAHELGLPDYRGYCESHPYDQDVAHELGLADYRGHCESYPHEHISEFFGWQSFDPSLQYKKHNGKIDYAPASMLNDGLKNQRRNQKIYNEGIPHKQIAECVLNTFVHPKKQSFSFLI